MATSLPRPNKNLTRQLAQNAARQDECLNAIVTSEAYQREQVLKAIAPALDARVQQALEKMDIEQLNMSKQGLRLNLLREAGIENVWQVSRMSFRGLCAIKGLGEQSAEKIRDTVRQILKNTRKTVSIRLSACAPEDAPLIEALYLYIHAAPLRQEATKLYREHHSAVTAELAAIAPANQPLGWLFASQKKKQAALDATQSLTARMAGQFGATDLVERFRKVATASQAERLRDFDSNAAAYYATLESIDTTRSRYETTQNGLPETLVEEISARPLDLSHLKATLRNYQTFGTQYILSQERVLLGDEMGLGKTVQAIAAMAALKAEGMTHFMVVCPASVLINWCREVPKHSDLTAIKVHGDTDEPLQDWISSGGVAVTTYETISRFTLPEDFSFHMLVADEAHYVKNPETLRTRAMKKLLEKTQRVLYMSGTPLENRVDEMCFLVSCLQPKVATGLEATKYLATAEQFRRDLAPVYLRRTREDVLQELPELTEKPQWCELSAEEKAVYKEAVQEENFMAMRQVSWHMSDVHKSVKAKRLLELCDAAREEGRKVIVFSFFRGTLEKAATILGDRCMPTISGSVSPQRRQEILDEFNAAPAGSVLISQVQAGGTGLNIQCASVIIFCEPQIKPSLETQAIARAYRMGQTRDVLVYRLLCEDTADEQMLAMLEEKQVQFDSFAQDSVVGQEALEAQQESDRIARIIAEEKAKLE